MDFDSKIMRNGTYELLDLEIQRKILVISGFRFKVIGSKMGRGLGRVLKKTPAG
jgi:hypothetical protein